MKIKLRKKLMIKKTNQQIHGIQRRKKDLKKTTDNHPQRHIHKLDGPINYAMLRRFSEPMISAIFIAASAASLP